MSKINLVASGIIVTLLTISPLSTDAEGTVKAQDEVCTDQTVLVTAEKDPDDRGVTFYATTDRTLEATVQIDCEQLDNLAASQTLPFTFSIDRPVRHLPVLRLRQTRPGRWHYGKWHTHYECGLVARNAGPEYIYSLPYAPGEQHKIGQTYFGETSHQKGTHSQYAVDFDMPVGTMVLAARAGVVIAIRQDSDKGGPDLRYERCGNYVVVKHGDGTYAEYWHLRQSGALVKLGQQVAAGTPIGLSGETGFAHGPHLHFEVFRVVDANANASIPFQMRTSQGVLKKLEKGCYY